MPFGLKVMMSNTNSFEACQNLMKSKLKTHGQLHAFVASRGDNLDHIVGPGDGLRSRFYRVFREEECNQGSTDQLLKDLENYTVQEDCCAVCGKA